ncbi:MAG TPA: thioredoxin domain-containing protein [Xanthomonadales bacterium]|nr:thioredoxin domain-containing protein [Xanthomonadales bacterium]
MTNHLAAETSPYLLQHAANPVDWYPWGEEALARAAAEHKPILLSIGYAACHWCHVMAHESFEDEETAALMNRWFINVKVDREERPDIDSIYMAAVTSMTGHGGWPMTVFLTPQGKPFFCGTYFPREPRYGMPSFSQLLSGIAEAWEKRQDEVQRSAEQVTRHLQDAVLPPVSGAQSSRTLQPELLEHAVRELEKLFDTEWGGFSAAPKFPQPMVLEFLLREHLRTGAAAPLRMVHLTLQGMAQGGVCDQLGGGFARYSTDREWLVPHFEKMLYDNAQLARIYLRAWQVSGDIFLRRVAEETLDYILREMRHSDGGFYSSQDADSEGVEGKFFVWSAAQVRAALGADADLFMRIHGVTDAGNWEGSNILRRVRSVADAAAAVGMSENQAAESLNRSRQTLFQLRSQRVWPGLDDKVLTAWNGLALSALAEAGRVLGRADYLAAATANAEFLRRELRRSDGRLQRSWKAGSGARYMAYLEDHACLAEGLLALYEASFESRWYDWAEDLAGLMLRHFKDPQGPGFYDTADDHEQLIHRPRDLQDNAMPSGNARAAMVLFRLGLYSGEANFLQAAAEAVAAQNESMRRYPTAFGEWLNVAAFMLGGPRELALAGALDTLAPMRAVVNEAWRPGLVVAAGMFGGANQVPLLRDRPLVKGQPSAYLCRNFTCQAPVTDPQALRQLLSAP